MTSDRLPLATSPLPPRGIDANYLLLFVLSDIQCRSPDHRGRRVHIFLFPDCHVSPVTLAISFLQIQ